MYLNPSAEVSRRNSRDMDPSDDLSWYSPVVDDGEQPKGEAHAEGHGHGVLGEGRHALEDLAGADDGADDRAETGFGEDDVCCSPCGISRPCTGSSQVRTSGRACVLCRRDWVGEVAW